MSGNLSASILARLLTLAKQRGDDYNLLLNRFALERLLARISLSPHADGFLLKGALLFVLWYDTPHRPTRDVDLLGFGPTDDADLIATFRDIAAMDLGDGTLFDPNSVKAGAIREDNRYGGTRISLVDRLRTLRTANRRGLRGCRNAGASDGGLSHCTERLSAPNAAGLSGLHRDR